MAYLDRSFSEQTIQRVLYDYFKKMYYRMSNVYMFGEWETDFFFMAKNKHLWEIEIKVDRQDFDRDFKLKPKKHRLLKKAFDEEDPGKLLLPNSFYFCCPEGVIPHEKVPEYAGLIEIHDRNKVKFIGERPNIHNNVKDVDSILLKKFYNKSLKLEKMLSEFRIKLFEAPDNREEIVKKFLKTIRM